MLRAVVFDLDDTLVDEATAIRSAFSSWAAAAGRSSLTSPEDWIQVSGKYYQHYLDGSLTYAQQGRSRVREFLGGRVSSDEADRLFEKYQDSYRSSWRLFDDTMPTLRRARAAGLSVAILTNGDAVQQMLKLTNLGIASGVDCFLASSEIGIAKPHPAAFQAIMRKLGSGPHETLMVGDHLINDIAGANEVGLAAVLIDRFDEHADAECSRVTSLHEISFTTHALDNAATQ